MTDSEITVIEIVEKFLKENGYAGLAHGECGCEIGDIRACGECLCYCEPGYKTRFWFDGKIAWGISVFQFRLPFWWMDEIREDY